jgi:glycosyltransferase involved in cell wall biosynthesis
MRITVVDPPAYTPPYDHSLCAALARRGLEVELTTSHFRYGPVPEPDGYRRRELFYRWNGSSVAAKAAQHPFDMMRLARHARRAQADIVHFQWLPIPGLDRHLLSRFPRPRLLTAHDILPREATARRRRAAEQLLAQVDAVVTHSEHGRDRLVGELGLPAASVSVIPHGAFDYLTRLRGEAPMDPGVGDLSGRKVVLCFGLMRPYKGIDLLIEAFPSCPEDTVLLIVGRAMMQIEPLERRAHELGIEERVRFVPRFVPEPQIASYFRRADLVVLPYREIEQSGVLSTALAFGCPLVLSAVGGFVEVGQRHGAARLVPAGDVKALGVALAELVADDAARAELRERVRQAAAGPYSWDHAAELTDELYRSLREQLE